MRKPSKNHKNKVPKITEEEYLQYLTALKGGENVAKEQCIQEEQQTQSKGMLKA